MGRKITVDSATLANKGLELVEAHWLFGVPYDDIEVVVHPTSVVHALVRFRDGALLAHVGLPDMRVPISYALTYPDRAPTPVPQLDLAGLDLSFEAPDTDAFPMLALARRAGERGGTAPCAYNAANGVAVEAFLEGRIGSSTSRRSSRRRSRASTERPRVTPRRPRGRRRRGASAGRRGLQPA
jgi:1-deoxy-D-xylulose-5-phosphate reductoisomerase